VTRTLRWLLPGLILTFFTTLFFSDYLLYDRLPIPSADPAVKYHTWAGAADWLRRGIIPLWQGGSSLGISLFSADASKTPLHLSSLFFLLIPDTRLAHVAFTAFLVVLLVASSFFYLTSRLRVPPVIALTGSALLIFTPGLGNEFLFNTFGGIAIVPLMLAVAGRFHERRSLRYAMALAGLLMVTYLVSNVAMVQFSLIYLAIYSLFMKCARPHQEVSVGRGVAFYALSLGAFLGLAAYFILPFFLEILRSDRSHIYGIYGALPIRLWLTSLHFPFTSWIFLDEKMLTTGLLTYLESLPRYFHVLLLPCLLLHFSNRRAFRPEERFFFLYVVGYIILSVGNQYVPILGLLVKYTKGTGWHRSTPLFFFSAAVCVSIVCAKLYAGELRIPGTGWGRFLFRLYRFHRFALLALYAGLFAAIVLVSVAVVKFDWEGIYPLLEAFTVRPRSHLEFYVSHYLAPQRLFAILMVPLGLALSLYWLERLRRNGGRSPNCARIAVLLGIAAIASQYPLTKLYYPFNRGVDKVGALSEAQFVRRLSLLDRIAIVFNRLDDIERRLIAEHRLDDATSGFRLQLLAQRYPEFTRFQSNITMHGSFFNTLGVGVYTRGANFTAKRTSRFHLALLGGNSRLRNIFQRKKGYLRIGPEEATSPLLDVAGVNYIFSSLPLTKEKLELVFRGDAYHIYRNARAVPRFTVVHQVRRVRDGDAALEAIQAPGFDPRREAIVETSVVFPTGSGDEEETSVTLVLFQPNAVELAVKTPSAGFLVFNDAYHPGWRAWINGVESRVHRANYVFKGVVVPAGRHKVEFRFSPPGFKAGLLITMATVFILSTFLSSALWGRRDKRS